MKNIILMPLKLLNSVLRFITSKTHKLQQYVEWNFRPTPEWFDHYCDQYYQWKDKNISFWVERGVLSNLVMKQDSELLELCCGDGFNSRHFYITKAKSITALDFDKTAIKHATKYNSHEKIKFINGDIRSSIPDKQFDNIVWDAAIEHFTEDEISKIMSKIKKSLKQGGILSGYTLVEKEDGEKHLHQHEYEFKSKNDLERFLTPYFKNVKIIETIYPERHNLYFCASDNDLPY